VNDVPDADRTVPAGEATPEPTTAEPATVEPVAPADEVTPQANPEQVMDLLADHVPLALLVDLVTPEGPASADILRDEGMPDDAWWEPEANPADGPDASSGADPAPDDPEVTG
jgi:hypothetical protein